MKTENIYKKRYFKKLHGFCKQDILSKNSTYFEDNLNRDV